MSAPHEPRHEVDVTGMTSHATGTFHAESVKAAHRHHWYPRMIVMTWNYFVGDLGHKDCSNDHMWVDLMALLNSVIINKTMTLDAELAVCANAAPWRAVNSWWWGAWGKQGGTQAHGHPITSVSINLRQFWDRDVKTRHAIVNKVRVSTFTNPQGHRSGKLTIDNILDHPYWAEDVSLGPQQTRPNREPGSCMLSLVMMSRDTLAGHSASVNMGAVRNLLDKEVEANYASSPLPAPVVVGGVLTREGHSNTKISHLLQSRWCIFQTDRTRVGTHTTGATDESLSQFYTEWQDSNNAVRSAQLPMTQQLYPGGDSEDGTLVMRMNHGLGDRFILTSADATQQMYHISTESGNSFASLVEDWDLAAASSPDKIDLALGEGLSGRHAVRKVSLASIADCFKLAKEVSPRVFQPLVNYEKVGQVHKQAPLAMADHELPVNNGMGRPANVKDGLPSQVNCPYRDSMMRLPLDSSVPVTEWPLYNHHEIVRRMEKQSMRWSLLYPLPEHMMAIYLFSCMQQGTTDFLVVPFSAYARSSLASIQTQPFSAQLSADGSIGECFRFALNTRLRGILSRYCCHAGAAWHPDTGTSESSGHKTSISNWDLPAFDWAPFKNEIIPSCWENWNRWNWGHGKHQAWRECKKTHSPFFDRSWWLYKSGATGNVANRWRWRWSAGTPGIQPLSWVGLANCALLNYNSLIIPIKAEGSFKAIGTYNRLFKEWKISTGLSKNNLSATSSQTDIDAGGIRGRSSFFTMWDSSVKECTAAVGSGEATFSSMPRSIKEKCLRLVYVDNFDGGEQGRGAQASKTFHPTQVGAHRMRHAVINPFDMTATSCPSVKAAQFLQELTSRADIPAVEQILNSRGDAWLPENIVGLRMSESVKDGLVRSICRNFGDSVPTGLRNFVCYQEHDLYYNEREGFCMPIDAPAENKHTDISYKIYSHDQSTPARLIPHLLLSGDIGALVDTQDPLNRSDLGFSYEISANARFVKIPDKCIDVSRLDLNQPIVDSPLLADEGSAEEQHVVSQACAGKILCVGTHGSNTSGDCVPRSATTCTGPSFMTLHGAESGATPEWSLLYDDKRKKCQAVYSPASGWQKSMNGSLFLHTELGQRVAVYLDRHGGDRDRAVYKMEIDPTKCKTMAMQWQQLNKREVTDDAFDAMQNISPSDDSNLAAIYENVCGVTWGSEEAVELPAWALQQFNPTPAQLETHQAARAAQMSNVRAGESATAALALKEASKLMNSVKDAIQETAAAQAREPAGAKPPGLKVDVTIGDMRVEYEDAAGSAPKAAGKTADDELILGMQPLHLGILAVVGVVGVMMMMKKKPPE